jgi:hypothetical protein
MILPGLKPGPPRREAGKETPKLQHCLHRELEEKQSFGYWICFRPQVREETPTMLGPL